MIRKIKNISQIGRFSSFTGKDDDLSFSPTTFIYGKNTQGKSTLTSIFHSLLNQNGGLILGRKTFGSQGQQNVVIETDTNELIFNGESWNGLLDIVIFDKDYIEKNVYGSGTEIVQQEQIAKIILGEKGKTLEKLFEDAQQKIRQNANDKAEITRQYNLSLNGNKILSFEEFKKLSKDTESKTKIENISNKIKSIENKQLIEEKLVSVLNHLTDEEKFETRGIKPALEVKQKLIKDHIKQNIESQNDELAFLNKGHQLLKDKPEDSHSHRGCVFCGQELLGDAENLIEAYSNFFSEEYKTLSTATKAKLAVFKKWDIVQNILAIQADLHKLGLDLDANTTTEDIKKSRDGCIQELEKKLEDLNFIIDDQTFLNLKNLIEALRKKVITLKKEYSASNPDQKLGDLKEKKEILEIQVKRHEDEWIRLCDKH